MGTGKAGYNMAWICAVQSGKVYQNNPLGTVKALGMFKVALWILAHAYAKQWYKLFGSSEIQYSAINVRGAVA